MESILLIIAIVLLVLDLDERRNARHRDPTSNILDAATRDEGRIRALTDRAVLNMMNEIRRHEPGKPS